MFIIFSWSTVVFYKHECSARGKNGDAMPGFPVLHQLPKSVQTYVHWDGDCSHEIKRHLLLVRKVMTNLDSILKSRNSTLLTQVYIVKAMLFPVVTYGCESWTIKKAVLKNWCFWTVVLEKILVIPCYCKEIKPVNPKGNKPWIFIGSTDAEAETPVFWPPDAKNWLIWKDPDAGKDWSLEEKVMTEDEMVGWHHQLNGHEFE